MSLKRPRPFGKNIPLHFHIFFRHYPAAPYLLKWLFLSLLLGTLIGCASAFFLQSLDLVTRYRNTHLWIITFLPVGGLFIGLLYHYNGKNITAGNSILLDTIQKPGTIIPLRMAPFVYLGTMITHLLGGSAGREGTALQIAGAFADQFSKPLKLKPEDRKVLLIAAIAAGFGSVFGTPLAGAVFALEVVFTGRLQYKALFPAFAAAILADLVTKFWHTHHTIYHIGLLPSVAFLPVLYAVLAGIVFGICAAVFSKAMHYTSRLYTRKITYPPLRPFVGGIIVAMGIWALGTTRYTGLGIPVITAAFDQQLPGYDFLLKMIFTILTLAAGFKGGEVTPLFFIGAALGSSLSGIVPLPTGLMAGMGFVAVFAGATNTPLACSIMAMELFGSECGVFVAIACVVSYLFSGNNSIYGMQVGMPKNRRFRAFEGKVNERPLSFRAKRDER